MGIRFSSLPPELRRRILAEAGPKPASPVARRPRTPAPVRRFSRVCSCLFEIIRPDGNYPDRCDGCGKPWPQ